MNGLLVAALIAAVLVSVRTYRRRRYFRHRRVQYDASWDRDRARAQFDELIPIARAALGRGVIETPELETVTLRGETPTERLLDAVRLATSRFGVAQEVVGAVYATNLPPGAAAIVTWEHAFEAVPGQDGLILRRGEHPIRWRIRVRPDLAGFETALVAVIGHEVAHIALKSQGIWLEDPAKNELLTEAAAVLAGFGPLMHEAAYVEHWQAKSSGDVVGVSEQGYVHQHTIELLMEWRRELSRSDGAA